MNYMKQIAGVLGVKLNEPFKILLDNQIIGTFPHMLTEDGCVCIKGSTDNERAPGTLYLILKGRYQIVRQPKWEPRLMDLAEFLARQGIDPVKYITGYYCSRCGEPGNRAYKHCPGCGVKME